MRPVNLQHIRVEKIDCSPEARAKQQAKLEADAKAAKAKEEAEAAKLLAARQKVLDESRAANPPAAKPGEAPK